MMDFWIILTGSLVAVSCALLGSFLVLRKMVMVGDAISHAVLPGIAIAYMITQSFDSVTMLLGASAIGLLTTFLIEFFHTKAKLQSDASIGVIFTWLFAVGVILVSVYTRGTDLDQDCVLYGEIINVPFNRWVTDGGTDMGPVSIWYLGVLTLIILLFLKLFYKQLFITTFDPAYAASIGISVTLWHYLLMGLVSLVTVASFEAVGAILVVAFIVAPPATAYLLTNDLKKMLIIAAGLGILCAVLGYGLATLAMGISTSGAMVSVSGIFFLLALLFSPIQGILFRRKTKEKVSEREKALS